MAQPAARPCSLREPTPHATVAVVVTTYNHTRFLSVALDSVTAQTRPADVTVVVDDGSIDDPGSVVARYAGVRLIRQKNQGLSSARNTGLRAVDTDYVVFLDADDLLAPRAIEAGLACFEHKPACGFVYGAHRHVAEDGRPLRYRFDVPGADPYAHLLRENFIAMHGAVMYRRDRLLAVGGFDHRLRCCEDYDVYLRMAERHPVAGHAEVVAEYRVHDGNMSSDHSAMLRAALRVHRRHEQASRADSIRRAAWLDGRRRWRHYYARELVAAARAYRRTGGGVVGTLRRAGRVLVTSPRVAWDEALSALEWRAESRQLPAVFQRFVPSQRREAVPPVGRVRLGDLNRLTPISRGFGFDRGSPVDRHYIESFLKDHASDIGGRVLEIGDDSYTRQYGGSRVTRTDILHVHPGNERATIVGDLSAAGVLPEGVFDCIVLTQTLHLIYDFHAAVDRLYRALAPSGVLLLTVPGITQIDRGEWGNTWFWSFTPTAIERLFGESFGSAHVDVSTYGNVLAATAFLQGLATEELDLKDLDKRDDVYPVIVALRAVKAETR